jgi:hypothetical protein
MFATLPEYGYTLTEHDPERPWIVLGSEQRAILLDDGASFSAWAAEHCPSPRWSVELDPWSDMPQWRANQP